MLTTVVTAILALLQTIGPAIGKGAISSVIATLEQIIPALAQEYQDVLPAIKNIIAALSSNPAATGDQLASLAALDEQVDQAFEAVATAAEAEDTPAAPPATAPAAKPAS